LLRLRPLGSARELGCSKVAHYRVNSSPVFAFDEELTSMSIVSRALEQLGHGRLSDDEIVKRVLAGDTGLFDTRATISPLRL
jgi:hypothetical protein